MDSVFVRRVPASAGYNTQHAIGITPESTFGDIKAELMLMDPVNLTHASILRAHYGPRPYWVHSDPNSRPGDTCQILYVVANGESQYCILGVVRTAQSDYPIAICKIPNSSHVPTYSPHSQYGSQPCIHSFRRNCHGTARSSKQDINSDRML